MHGNVFRNCEQVPQPSPNAAGPVIDSRHSQWHSGFFFGFFSVFCEEEMKKHHRDTEAQRRKKICKEFATTIKISNHE